MRQAWRVALFLLLSVAASARAATDASTLSWLEGRWTGVQDGVEMEEHWTSAGGGVLLGMHKDVKGGRTIAFEFLRIGADDSGELTYFASPQGAPPTPFRLKESADQRVVFENAAHDFPQRILYWLDADGALHARVEGERAGKTKALEWVWRRGGR